MEVDKQRLGGRDWVERMDDDLSDADRVVIWLRGVVGAVFALGLIVTAFVILIRWTVSGG
jgi:uncharacterized protein YbjT (DUF2867 family)